MTEEQAEDICIAAMVKAHGGQATTSKRFFKAMRVLNMRDARELYESLSEEFVRKGIASNRFSELEQLFTIAEVSLADCDDKDKELTQLKQFAREASREIKAAHQYLESVYDLPSWKEEPEYAMMKSFEGFLNSDIYKQVKKEIEE